MEARVEYRLREPAEIPALAPRIEQYLEARDVPADAVYQVNLVLDEWLTNVLNYGAGRGDVHVLLSLADDQIEVQVTDSGVPFDPLDAPPADTDSSLDDRKIGGLGLHFMREMMDTVAYRRDGDHNVLTLRRSLRPGRGSDTTTRQE
ncbi:ATP-binding protein [Zavarzinia sp. CC-PAN008]|uniref:ATP-binding protein n=1 Tax=Zavarzinia sp. CC-PAN008 TaxID=3243332 RepID=UPI003F7440E8